MGNASRGGRPIDGKRTLRGGPPDCFRSSPSPLRFLFFGSFFSFSERKERTRKNRKRMPGAAGAACLIDDPEELLEVVL